MSPSASLPLRLVRELNSVFGLFHSHPSRPINVLSPPTLSFAYAFILDTCLPPAPCESTYLQPNRVLQGQKFELPAWEEYSHLLVQGIGGGWVVYCHPSALFGQNNRWCRNITTWVWLLTWHGKRRNQITWCYLEWYTIDYVATEHKWETGWNLSSKSKSSCEQAVLLFLPR